MHGRRWLLAVGMTLLAQAATPPTGAPATPPPTADMLLDLDLLREMSVARDRELLGRMRLLERMRMLETWRILDSAAPIVPADRETK